MKIVIFDMDGTLANCRHRLGHILKRPKDWEAFYEACDGDEPNWEVVGIAKAVLQTGDYSVQLWTGRPSAYRHSTEECLISHGLDALTGKNLLMRNVNDRRKDYEVKQEWLLRELRRGSHITAVFEDRARVVTMYRSHGIRCLQVADGNY